MTVIEELCLHRQTVVPSGPATESLVIPDGKIPIHPQFPKQPPPRIVLSTASWRPPQTVSAGGGKSRANEEAALFHPHALWMEKFTQLAALVDTKCFRTRSWGGLAFIKVVRKRSTGKNSSNAKENYNFHRDCSYSTMNSFFLSLSSKDIFKEP